MAVSAVWLSLCMLACLAVGLMTLVISQRHNISRAAEDVQLSETRVRARDFELSEQKTGLQLMGYQVNAKKKEVDDLEAELNKMTLLQLEKAEEVKTCQESMTEIENAVAVLQKENTDTESQFTTLKKLWTEEIASLQQQLKQRSRVCDYVREGLKKNELCPPKEG